LDGVVGFIRKEGNEEILALINLTNRIIKITVDAPASSAGHLLAGSHPASGQM
jgi:hypothetical protein